MSFRLVAVTCLVNVQYILEIKNSSEEIHLDLNPMADISTYVQKMGISTPEKGLISYNI